ncbi:uncharacterized protein LOC119073253 isoform X3 [Bradysia coprophila]|uniref:uncharacterized protein LOC119073253 isoform X3 n=1 Tax=Bradysia coprophila TaxID=38358 RepID=UPI00187D705D|nr:uncharacterized protein LOC119073253 isoform X3 [Bradysia coprophila]
MSIHCDVHLQLEIEKLKQALLEKQSELISMETACLRESDRQVELEDSIIAWQDKYDRLYESHKRVQKVNQNLEDKLLKLVDRNSGERAQLTSDVATLSVRLAQANYNIATLQREIERYKTDMSLAIQLLQCKPDHFVSQKVISLPPEIQSKVAQYMRLETTSHSDSEGSVSNFGAATSGSYRVLPASDSPPPVCPFPPTGMVYSMRGHDQTTDPDQQMISPSVMARYLEEELKSSDIKHCDTCLCVRRDMTVLATSVQSYTIGTQTVLHGDANNSLCLRCNNNLNSPSRTNSPYIMKLVKSSDSVISETKSSVSGSNDNDKLFVPAKKDDLTVNPILGHHRLCDIVSDRPPKILNNDECDDLISYQQPKMLHTLPAPVQKKSPTQLKSSENFAPHTNYTSASRNGCNRSERMGHDTGSTNSLWSKSSSNANNNSSVDGARMFETFNRNLIKSIKADNPKISGPRLCAMRIQNGSNNILLDNIESTTSPIIYTRRSRFLDDELDETKDVITSSQCDIPTEISSTNISMVMPNGQPSLIDQSIKGNKSDVENSVASSIIPKKNDLFVSNAKDINLMDHIDTVRHHHRLDKVENETILSKNVNKMSAQSTELEMQDNAFLRRQQLTRVAEWVQNNHLENIEPISSQSSMDAASIDSGYKTKVNNNCADTKVMLLDGDNCLHNADNGNIVSDNSLSDDVKQIESNFAQLNNNLINLNEHINGMDRHSCVSATTKQSVGSQCFPKNQNAQLDLAQMEYNVKQFLLKQNEWSNNRKTSGGDELIEENAGNGTDLASDLSLANKNPHRTETNL